MSGADAEQRRAARPRARRGGVELGRVEHDLHVLVRRLAEAARDEDVAVGELHCRGVRALVGERRRHRPGAVLGGVNFGRVRGDGAALAVGLAAGHEDGPVGELGGGVRVARRAHAPGGRPTRIEQRREGEPLPLPRQADRAHAGARIEHRSAERRARIAVDAAAFDRDADGEPSAGAVDPVGRWQPEPGGSRGGERLERVGDEAQPPRPRVERDLVLDRAGAPRVERHEVLHPVGGDAEPEVLAAGRAALVQEVAAGRLCGDVARPAQARVQAMAAWRPDGEGARRADGEGDALLGVAEDAEVIARALVGPRRGRAEQRRSTGGCLEGRRDAAARGPREGIARRRPASRAEERRGRVAACLGHPRGPAHPDLRPSVEGSAPPRSPPSQPLAPARLHAPARAARRGAAQGARAWGIALAYPTPLPSKRRLDRPVTRPTEGVAGSRRGRGG